MRPYLTDIRKIIILTNFVLLPFSIFAQAGNAIVNANFNSGICELKITDLGNTSSSINISSDNGVIIIKNVQIDQKSLIQSSQAEILGNISSPAFFVNTVSKSEIELQFNSPAAAGNLELTILIMPQGSSEPFIRLNYPDGSIDTFKISFSEQTAVRINP